MTSEQKPLFSYMGKANTIQLISFKIAFLKSDLEDKRHQRHVLLNEINDIKSSIKHSLELKEKYCKENKKTELKENGKQNK